MAINNNNNNNNNNKGKFVPVHNIQAYRDSRGIAPLIFNLGTRWR
jgi:hypothetical protein